MLKKFLIFQVVIIAIGITLGSILLNQFDPSLKTVHGTVGALIGVTSVASVYVAFREKASTLLLTLVSIAALLAILAYVGGKITDTNYDLGLTIMRSSAIAALLVSMFSLYKAKPAKK